MEGLSEVLGPKQFYVPIIMGIAAWIKKYTKTRKELIPLIVIALSAIAQCLVDGGADYFSVLKGLVWGFTTVGLYSAGKNTMGK